MAGLVHTQVTFSLSDHRRCLRLPVYMWVTYAAAPTMPNDQYSAGPEVDSTAIEIAVQLLQTRARAVVRSGRVVHRRPSRRWCRHNNNKKSKRPV